MAPGRRYRQHATHQLDALAAVGDFAERSGDEIVVLAADLGCLRDCELDNQPDLVAREL